ncbi:hypothetical protein [Cystobacter fuscus]
MEDSVKIVTGLREHLARPGGQAAGNTVEALVSGLGMSEER